ncbi:MAG: hypothetical protein ACLF0G_17475 [Candidatus Brocadiia bacterium]
MTLRSALLALLATAALAAAEAPRQARALRQAEKLGPVDFLGLATAFADCMIEHGRDRYGAVHSPLFANLLLRGERPTIGPEPRFAPSPYDTSGMNTPFRKFDFNKVLNYPPGLGSEGPHKVTLCGCDPYEDRELYETLFELSRITGRPRYRREAERALAWWFRNTQGPAGLYPWGEHLGWDFRHECPTYFAGPSKHLYAACYHEVKDRVPFLDVLARLPAARAGQPTPLERYALGIWEAHFWDPQRAFFDRHGDYTGEDDRRGEPGGFPAHLAAYFRVWAAAIRHASRPEMRRRVEAICHKALDMAIARTRRHGFFPLTFEPELRGKPAGEKTPGQSTRLARHAREVAEQLAEASPELAAKLRTLATLHLGDPAPAPGRAKPPARLEDLSQATTPDAHADAILRNLAAYRAGGDPAFLDVARTHARIAYVLFCDQTCPLPKARVDSHQARTTQGKPFPDHSFRGARLMKAFALLGEALREAGQE